MMRKATPDSKPAEILAPAARKGKMMTLRPTIVKRSTPQYIAQLPLDLLRPSRCVRGF